MQRVLEGSVHTEEVDGWGCSHKDDLQGTEPAQPDCTTTLSYTATNRERLRTESSGNYLEQELPSWLKNHVVTHELTTA